MRYPYPLNSERGFGAGSVRLEVICKVRAQIE